MFGLPLPKVPKGVKEKANQMKHGMSMSSSVADFKCMSGALGKKSVGKNEKKSGSELRSLEKFLKEHDPDDDWAGLARVCQEKIDEKTGNVSDTVTIWTTDAGKCQLERDQVKESTADQMMAEFTVEKERMRQEILEEKEREFSLKNSSAAKSKRQSLKRSMSVSSEPDGGFNDDPHAGLVRQLSKSPTKNLKPVVSPFKQLSQDHLDLLLTGLTSDVDELGKIKPHGATISGRVIVKKIGKSMGMFASEKKASVRCTINEDGMLLYGNEYLDLTTIETVEEDPKSSNDMVVVLPGPDSKIVLSIDERSTAEAGELTFSRDRKEWIEALQKHKVTSEKRISREEFNRRKDSALDQIETLKSTLQTTAEGHEEVLKEERQKLLEKEMETERARKLIEELVEDED
jgi:hypothetical protein